MDSAQIEEILRMSAVGVRARNVSGRRSRSRSKVAARVLSTIVSRLIVFGVVAIATYFMSSMAGQVQMEQARKEGARAKLRLMEAERSADDLARKVSALQDETRVALWAESNGFYRASSLVPVEDSNLVAAR